MRRRALSRGAAGNLGERSSGDADEKAHSQSPQAADYSLRHLLDYRAIPPEDIYAGMTPREGLGPSAIGNNFMRS